MDKEIKFEDIDQSIKRWISDEPTYQESRYNLFWAKLVKEGLQPYHYQGHFGYHGPAVLVHTIEDMNRVKEIVRIPMQYDKQGTDYVVFPK